MLRLGVNIDHVATLRQARYRGQVNGEPDPVAAAVAVTKALVAPRYTTAWLAESAGVE